MDLLGRFRKLDSSLQRGLDNGLARVFGGAVVPAEIEELLKQEAETALLHDEHHATIAPDYYVVLLSAKDLQNLTENSPQLADQLAGRLNRFLRNEGWQTRERAQVELRSDEGLHTGQLRCHTSFGAPVSAEHTLPDPDAPAQSEENSGAEPRWHQPSENQYGGYAPSADTPDPQASSARYSAETYSAETYPAEPYPAAETEYTQHNPQPADEQPYPPMVDPTPSTPTVSAPHIPSGRPSDGKGPDTDQPWAQRDNTQAHTSGNDYSGSNAYTDVPDTRPSVSLLLQDGSSRVHHVSSGETVIGRSAQADFRLPDTGVSRQHAKIVWDGDDVVLVDLDSTNGTFVNDVEIKDWLLDDGDVINLGHSDIEVRIVKHHSTEGN